MDLDSLPDDWERQYFGNLNQNPSDDYDGDGLTNLEEYNHGTDPTKWDTDGDGYLDKEEIEAGTNPNDPNDYPMNQPPTCIIELQKNGNRISEVSRGEFFDIYVGYSTDDKGIKQVRFSSDDVQDGIPTGEWTEWCDWDTSSGDWNATNKIKRWAFATVGYKEVLAEVKDEIGQTAICSATIFVPAPVLPVITSPLVITPVKDIYSIGDSLEAEFTIKNIGDIPITIDVLTVGGRLNGQCPTEGCPDFTHLPVTLQPDEPYQYKGSFTPTQFGNYHFFIAYRIANPTPDEKRLLDENNWNTCVELGEGLTHTDRAKNIIVYEEGLVPEEVSQLRETINRRREMDRIYPTYLPDPEVSWAASVWITVSSVWTHVQEKYDELWHAGVDYDCMSRMEAEYAKRFLDGGDIDSAREHLQNSFLYDKISYLYFYAATEVFDANIVKAELTVKSILKLIEVGTTLLNPAAGKFASYVFIVPNYIADRDLFGEDEALKNHLRDLAFKAIFSIFEYPQLGGRTLENYLNNRIGKITFPYLQTLFKNNEDLQFHLSHALKKAGVEAAERLSKEILDELCKLFPSRIYKGFSPIELRVRDSQEQITGLINGEVRHEISRSFYRNGTIIIYFPYDSYTCEVKGKEEGTYRLEITSVENGEATIFTATDIPISPSATHQYSIDWDVLSQGGEGVTVQIDSNGDGMFEQIITSDNELPGEEFWPYPFEDPRRGTKFFINTNNGTFRFTAPDGFDSGVIKAKSMKVRNTGLGSLIKIKHKDGKTRIFSISIDTGKDFCVALVNIGKKKNYLLTDPPGIE